MGFSKNFPEPPVEDKFQGGLKNENLRKIPGGYA